MRTLMPESGLLLATLVLAACGADAAPAVVERTAVTGTPVAVIDTLIPDVLEASGTATPIRAATLSTKLMGSVTTVLVHEGDRVASGQSLVRLDARDLEAKRSQVEAGLAEATADARRGEGTRRAHPRALCRQRRHEGATRPGRDRPRACGCRRGLGHARSPPNSPQPLPMQTCARRSPASSPGDSLTLVLSRRRGLR